MKGPSSGLQRSPKPRCFPLLWTVLAVAAAFALGALYGSSLSHRTFSMHQLQQRLSKGGLDLRAQRNVLEAGHDILQDKLVKQGGQEQELDLARQEARDKEVALQQAREALQGKEAELAQLRHQVEGLQRAQQEAVAKESALKKSQEAAASREAALKEAQQAVQGKEAAMGQLQEKLAALEEEAGRLVPRRLAGRIPKILHHVFIPPDKPENANLTMWPHHELWVQNCRYRHSERAGWEYRLWNTSASEALIAEHYPDFFEFYRENITLANEKSDMMRYIVLHKFGGLYLDSDVDCWRDSSDMLEGYDVVLQGSHSAEGTGSASIASVPGAHVWMAALELVKGRNVMVDTWVKSIAFTGPDLLADSLEHVGVKRNPDRLFPELTEKDGLVYKVHPAGTFFLPCQWWQPSCRRKVYQDLGIGMQNLTNLVGMHRFAGSWIGGKEEGKGIVNVTDELCNPKPDAFRRQLLGLTLPVQ